MTTQPALFAPQRYNGQFATIHFDEWGWQLTCWQMGRPTGHKWYSGITEAVLEAFNFLVRMF